MSDAVSWHNDQIQMPSFIKTLPAVTTELPPGEGKGGEAVVTLSVNGDIMNPTSLRRLVLVSVSQIKPKCKHPPKIPFKHNVITHPHCLRPTAEAVKHLQHLAEVVLTRANHVPGTASYWLI